VALGALNETANATSSTLNQTILNLTNQTINETVTQATVASQITGFIPLVFHRLWLLIAAPFAHPEMLWIVLPLFFTLFVMEFYYERHDNEELGWGAAVANSMILIFVAIDLIKTTFGYKPPWTVAMEIMRAIVSGESLPTSPQIVVLILFMGALGISVTLINYFHLLPGKVMFIVSGHPTINFLGYFAIAIVYSTHSEHPIPFDIPTLVAGVLLFVLILLGVFSIKRMTRGNRNSIWR
jgi:hypothetical protein